MLAILLSFSTNQILDLFIIHKLLPNLLFCFYFIFIYVGY